MNIVSAIGAKGITILTQIVSVPLTLHYLGAERYGIWLTLSSFIAMLSFADLGMGNGVLTRVAVAHGKDDRALIAKYVSSSVFSFLFIAAAIIILFFAAYPYVDWGMVFNAKTPQARSECGPAAAAFAILFALSIPASLVQKVQTGLQHGFIVSAWNAVGNLLSLLGILIATNFRLPLQYLVFAIMAGPLIGNLGNATTFFIFNQKDIRPRFALFSLNTAQSIAKTGTLFFALQIVVAIAYSSDALIISHLVGPQAVPLYSVPERMFALVGMLVGMGLGPLWPAYGEALSRGDHDWARRTLWRSLGAAIGVAAIGAGSVALVGPTLIRLWVGTIVVASPSLLVGLAIWKVLEAGSNAVAMFLNGAHVVKFQLVVATVTGIATILLKFVLISRFGVNGAIWGSILAYIIFAAGPYYLRLRNILSSTST